MHVSSSSIEIRPAGGRLRVRVIVDRDGGVDLDAVAALSSQLSEALDATDVLGEDPYVLEVTSPGVDRPLVLPRHWGRSVGRLVRVQVGESQIVGRVESCDESSVTVRLEPDGQSQTLAYAQIDSAVVEIEFSRGAGDDHGH